MPNRARAPWLCEATCALEALEQWLARHERQDFAGGAKRRLPVPLNALVHSGRLVRFEWSERVDDGLACTRVEQRAALVCDARALAFGAGNWAREAGGEA